MQKETEIIIDLLVPEPGHAAAIEPRDQVVHPEVESSPVVTGRQAWRISTGRHKTFSIEHAHANDICSAVQCMAEIAYILRKRGETPAIEEVRLYDRLSQVHW